MSSPLGKCLMQEFSFTTPPVPSASSYIHFIAWADAGQAPAGEGPAGVLGTPCWCFGLMLQHVTSAASLVEACTSTITSRCATFLNLSCCCDGHAINHVGDPSRRTCADCMQT